MTIYRVLHTQLPEEKELNIWHDCNKVNEKSGRLKFFIDDNYDLDFENVEATQRKPSTQNVPGSVPKNLNLRTTLENLCPKQEATSTASLLKNLGDKNKSGFLCAVLIKLGNVEKQ